MAQKITLSIPDLLHEKLKEWRDSFNFSKMFQDAVTDAIQRKEEFQKRFSQDFDMSEIIKRLQQEKCIWEKQFFKSGKNEGIKWAQSAHYEDLLYVINFNDTYELTNEAKFKAYFEDLHTKNDLGKYAGENEVDHEVMFMDGWFYGVNEFWTQIKEKI